MTELITVESFGRALVWALAALFVSCWAGAAVYGWRTGRWRDGLAIGGLASLSAPVIYGLWCFYSHSIVYDPATGTAGLHRVSVLLIDAGLFMTVGGIAGLIAARVLRRRGEPHASEE